MIVPDVNLLVYAYTGSAPFHEEARQWWESVLSGREPVGLTYVTAHGYVRLMTHPRIMTHPLRPDAALEDVDAWLSVPSVSFIGPGPRHMELLRHLLERAGTGANLVTDAVIAAIAIEYQATVYSTDTDFARFEGVRWANPLTR